MKGLTKDEKSDALKSLMPDFDDSPLPILDRSTLERAAECPFQAHAIDNRLVNPVAACMDSGNEVHAAYSGAVREWIDSGGDIEPHDLRSSIEYDLANARPDIQPDVLQGGRPAIWSWVKFIEGVHPDNILAYDGGEPQGRGGQLAWDMPDMGVRVTSEIDLLIAGESIETVEEIDYKSGWKEWTATDVKQSFQFQMHAALILRAFPTIAAVNTSVWSTRSNTKTFKVAFLRKNLNDFEMRIRKAVEAWKASKANPACWPAYDKCALCPAAVICPEASADIRDVAKDPKAGLLQLVAIDAKRKSLATLLGARAKQLGHDIVAGDAAYGTQKPKSTRKTPASLYSVNSSSDSDTE